VSEAKKTILTSHGTDLLI